MVEDVHERRVDISLKVRRCTLQRQKLFIVLVLSTLLTIPASTTFADQVFFGEDLGQGESVRLPSHPNSDVAHNDFLSNLVGVGTENFESFASGTGAPLPLTFPGAGTATLNGDGFIARVTTGTNGVGRYPISGNQYWDSSNVFSIDFSAPIAAFGFYGVDIGDFGGQVTLTLRSLTPRL